MRKGFASLSLLVQEVLRRDPLSGHLFCFRGRRGDLLKVIWHDGQGACLFTKRLEQRQRLLMRTQQPASLCPLFRPTETLAALAHLRAKIRKSKLESVWSPSRNRNKNTDAPVREASCSKNSTVPLLLVISTVTEAIPHLLELAFNLRRSSRTLFKLLLNGIQSGTNW